MTYIMLYTIGVLASTSLAMAWFKSGLPFHVASLLRMMFGGEFLDTIADKAFFSTRNDWENMVSAHTVGKSAWISLLVELLSCRVCLSFHISLCVALAICIYTGGNWHLVPVAFFSWPFLINILLNTLEK